MKFRANFIDLFSLRSVTFCSRIIIFFFRLSFLSLFKMSIDGENASASTTLLPSAFKVSVKAPTFNRDDSEIWFHQLEAQFEISGVKTDQTKYSYLLAALDCETIKCVREKILRPPENNRYVDLKKAIVERLSDSAKIKLDRLLKGLQLGDKKPSQLLREMQSLAGDQIQDEVLLNLWLQRLPSQAQSVLTSLEECSLDKLASTADKILEVQRVTEVYSVEQNKSTALDELINQVNSLSKRVNDLILTRNSRNSSTNRSTHDRQHSRSRRNSNEALRFPLCWYHFKYDEKAHKCLTPCNFGIQKNTDNNKEN